MSKLHLYYWQGTGKGQTSRLLLEYLQIPYEETRYTPEKAHEWFGKDKHSIGLDFPNLPSIVDGDIKISENLTLTSYLPTKANKPDLNGKGNDQFKVSEIKNMINDMSTQAYLASLEKDSAKQQQIYTEKLHAKLTYLKKFYEGKEWGVGYLTVADFYVYCIIQSVRQTFKEQFDNEFGHALIPFVERFEAIPAIASYMKSERYIQYKI